MGLLSLVLLRSARKDRNREFFVTHPLASGLEGKVGTPGLAVAVGI